MPVCCFWLPGDAHLGTTSDMPLAKAAPGSPQRPRTTLRGMNGITWQRRPDLVGTTVLVGLSGWSDAAEAASGAARYLLDTAESVDLLAYIDDEAFFDYSRTRPAIDIEGGITRDLTWPAIRISHVRLPASRDLVLVEGPEPEFRWPTITRTLVEAFRAVDASRVIVLGSFIGSVPHTRPVPVFAVAGNEQLLTEHSLVGAQYEGPTGIVGALHHACTMAGLPTIGLWTAIPHYTAANPNPRAMLTHLGLAARIARLDLDLEPLEGQAAEYSRQVDLAVAASEELADFVAELEEESDQTAAAPPGERLIQEIERFLRHPES